MMMLMRVKFLPFHNLRVFTLQLPSFEMNNFREIMMILMMLFMTQSMMYDLLHPEVWPAGLEVYIYWHKSSKSCIIDHHDIFTNNILHDT